MRPKIQNTPNPICSFYRKFILFFQTALKEMRSIDDKIVYAINQSIPTASFKGQSDAKQNCKELSKTVSQF